MLTLPRPHCTPTAARGHAHEPRDTTVVKWTGRFPGRHQRGRGSAKPRQQRRQLGQFGNAQHRGRCRRSDADEVQACRPSALGIAGLIAYENGLFSSEGKMLQATHQHVRIRLGSGNVENSDRQIEKRLEVKVFQDTLGRLPAIGRHRDRVVRA